MSGKSGNAVQLAAAVRFDEVLCHSVCAVVLLGIYVGDSAMLVFKSENRYICLGYVVKYPVNELVISETVGGKNKPVQTALADERVNILNALGVVVTIFV